MPNNLPSILILSGVRGDTRRYRTFHLYEQACLLHMDSQLSHVTDPELRKKARGSSIVFVHRATYDKQIAWLEREIHRQGGTLIQDIDDLLFEPEAFKHIDSKDFADPIRAALYQQDMRLYRKTLEGCDAVMASTDYLAQCASQLDKPVAIHRNAFSFELLERSEAAYSARQTNPAKLVIGYASGTSTHDKDFALIKPALQSILKRHLNVELWIVGLLDPGDDWGNLDHRIKKFKLIPWRKLPEIQAQFDINLAPLRTDNPFGQSKSEIKYMEAGLLRVPTIANPSEAYQYAIRQRDNGFLASDTSDWEQTLDRLIGEPELRNRAGEKAYLDVIERYHPSVRANQLAVTINSILGREVAFPISDLDKAALHQGAVPTFWCSEEVEKSPSLIQMGLYALRYRGFGTLLKQLWIFIRRLLAPLIPYQSRS